MSDHSILAPSSAETWIGCSGSVAMSAGLPDETTSYAEEGTKAHALAADILKGKPIIYDDLEMLSYVRVYTDAIQRAAEGKILLVEKRVSIEDYTGEPEGAGTSDAIIVDPAGGPLEIHDLKYGMGHIVDAEQNKQMMLYALGALLMVETFAIFDAPTEIKVVVHQPRRDHLSEWTVSVEELRKFGFYAKQRGLTALSMDKGEGLAPSDKACLWCKAKAVCPALAKAVTDAVFKDFENIPDNPNPATELKPVVAVSPATLFMIEEYLAAVHAFIYAQLSSGNELEEWKLVSGREGNRRWADEKKVLKLASKLKIPKKLIVEPGDVLSPTKLQAVVPKEKWPLFESIVVRNPAKTTHAPKYDKRASVAVTTVDEFSSYDPTNDDNKLDEMFR
jgi:hypothetical protein